MLRVYGNIEKIKSFLYLTNHFVTQICISYKSKAYYFLYSLLFKFFCSFIECCSRTYKIINKKNFFIIFCIFIIYKNSVFCILYTLSSSFERFLRDKNTTRRIFYHAYKRNLKYSEFFFKRSKNLVFSLYTPRSYCNSIKFLSLYETL